MADTESNQDCAAEGDRGLALVYNITTPITAARFVNIPHERSKFSKSYREGHAAGKSEFEGLTVREAREKYRAAKRECRDHTRELKKLDKEWQHLTGTVAACADLNKWAKGFLTFQRPTGHAFLSFQASIGDETIHNLYNLETPLRIDEYQREVFDDSMIFVIEHNWFNAINKADEFANGSFRLPYEICRRSYTSHTYPLQLCSDPAGGAS